MHSGEAVQSSKSLTEFKKCPRISPSVENLIGKENEGCQNILNKYRSFNCANNISITGTRNCELLSVVGHTYDLLYLTCFIS
jgi:hypothetical protein